MEYLKSKFFYLNLIALAVLVLEYFLANNMFEQYILWQGLAVLVLNAIAGMIQAQEVKQLKRTLTKHGIIT